MAEVTPWENTHTRDKCIGGPTNMPMPPVEIEVGLLTGGIDKPYAFGLAMELISKGVCVEFIGSDEVDSPELHESPNLRFLNLRGDQARDASLATKIRRIVTYYARLIRYAWVARPQVFHILWNNKFQIFDRTLLMLYYKLRGKKIVFTAHNVNAGKRDSNDSLLNRVTLRIQYHLADHVFVHTETMKKELLTEFGVSEKAVTVIPFGINNSVPDTDLTSAQARQRLGIGDGDRTILFFGRIGPYKGLEALVSAFQRLSAKSALYRLIIAGQVKGGYEKYLEDIQRTISGDGSRARIIQKLEYIPDADTELYFKAADVLVLPYKQIFQSGVLFLGFNFGLPAIAADVGCFKEDIIEGETGFLFRPGELLDLTNTIERYFESDLFRTLDSRRPWIRHHAMERHSWNVVGEMTLNVYANLLES